MIDSRLCVQHIAYTTYQIGPRRSRNTKARQHQSIRSKQIGAKQINIVMARHKRRDVLYDKHGTCINTAASSLPFQVVLTWSCCVMKICDLCAVYLIFVHIDILIHLCNSNVSLHTDLMNMQNVAGGRSCITIAHTDWVQITRPADILDKSYLMMLDRSCISCSMTGSSLTLATPLITTRNRIG